MALTQAQLITLKADIYADSTLAAWAATGRMAQEISDAYNLQAATAHIVWRTAVEPDEWRAAIMYGGGGVQFDGLAASKRECLIWAFSGVINPSRQEIRVAIDDWCGTQNTLKAAIAAAEKRTATRAEKLFSTGTGSDVAPATMGYEGALAYQDINAALALP